MLPGWNGIWIALLILNIAAMVVALIAAEVSRRNWLATRSEHPGASDDLLGARTRRSIPRPPLSRGRVRGDMAGNVLI